MLEVMRPHKELFLQIRNYLAGRLVGATRDETLLEEVMKCLFCLKYMLLNGADQQGSIAPATHDLSRIYQETFEEIKKKLPSVFLRNETIALDSASLDFVHSRLRLIDFFNTNRDPVGDLYEAFIGSAIRGSEGQFFTPQNAGRWLVEALDPRPGERVIDPACGAGGFLLWTLQHTRSSSDGTPPNGMDLIGIEKDRYLARLAQARLGIIRFRDSQVVLGDALSLTGPQGDLDFTGQFDVVLTNPPYGKNIDSASNSVRKSFQLSYKWSRVNSGTLRQTDELNNKTPPQVLFLERILSLLKPGGRAGVVVPESLLSSRHYEYAVAYLLERCRIESVVGMPESLFKSSGKGGTHTKTCLLTFYKKPSRSTRRLGIFMAEAKWCGNDSRGKDIPRDDLPTILDDYNRFRSAATPSSGIAYIVPEAQICTNVLAPRYYDPRPAAVLLDLARTHELVSMDDLIRSGAIEVRTGHEVGKLAYGMGKIPFVRTSDISNWEIKIDPKHLVSEEVYDSIKDAQDVRPHDILMVRDGTYLIGSCAIITEYDSRIVYQSHIYKLRSTEHQYLSPYLLLAVLSSDPVQAQIRAKSFTQDIIDSLGTRLRELILPLPRSVAKKKTIIATVEQVIRDRIEARELMRKAKRMVADQDISSSPSSKYLAINFTK